MARNRMFLVSVVHRSTAKPMTVVGMVGRSSSLPEHQPLHHSFVARPARKHGGRSHTLHGHGNHHDPDKESADNFNHSPSLADSPLPFARLANLSRTGLALG